MKNLHKTFYQQKILPIKIYKITCGAKMTQVKTSTTSIQKYLARLTTSLKFRISTFKLVLEDGQRNICMKSF